MASGCLSRDGSVYEFGPIGLERIKVVEGVDVTHLLFRVINKIITEGDEKL